MSDFLKKVRKERLRQVTEEGWNSEHDDMVNSEGQLACAASCYAAPADCREVYPQNYKPVNWPWELKWWKPTPEDRKRELIKAAALLCAEYDRIVRIEHNLNDNV